MKFLKPILDAFLELDDPKTLDDVSDAESFEKDETVEVTLKNGEIKKAKYVGLFETTYTWGKTKGEIGKHIHHTVSLNNEEWHFPLGTVFKSKD